MDALVPMASQPAPMASRNWMLRRLMVETIRNDPEWYNGDYTTQPSSARLASVFFGVATSGGTLAYQHLAPTREQADKLVDERLAAAKRAAAGDVSFKPSVAGQRTCQGLSLPMPVNLQSTSRRCLEMTETCRPTF